MYIFGYRYQDKKPVHCCQGKHTVLNQTAEYALRVMVYLAGHNDGARVRAPELVKALKIPAGYLAKVLHQLAREGLLESQRGKTGGFRIARDPRRVMLADIVEPFDAGSSRSGCLLGRATCSDRAPCAAHAKWKAVSAAHTAFFGTTSLGAIASR